MARRGNKHKSRANVAEWGSKARKEDSKQKREKDKQITRQEVLDELDAELSEIIIPNRIK